MLRCIEKRKFFLSAWIYTRVLCLCTRAGGWERVLRGGRLGRPKGTRVWGICSVSCPTNGCFECESPIVSLFCDCCRKLYTSLGVNTCVQTMIVDPVLSSVIPLMLSNRRDACWLAENCRRGRCAGQENLNRYESFWSCLPYRIAQFSSSVLTGR